MKTKRNSGVTRIDQGVYWSERYPFLQVRSTFASRHPYAAHFHDSLSLGVVFKGGTMLGRNGAASIVNAGQMVFIAPMEPHSCNPLGGRARGYHMFYIDPEWALAQLDAPPGSRLIVRERIMDDSALFAALMRLAAAIREGRDDRAGCGALRGAVVEQCAVRPAAEDGTAAAVASWTEGLGAGADGDAAPVLARARALGMRRESFIRSFRRAAGVTPVRYRQCLRLIQARDCLRRGRSVVDTALSCGYADQSHFHRMCVKYLSATPAQLTPQTSLSFKK